MKKGKPIIDPETKLSDSAHVFLLTRLSHALDNGLYMNSYPITEDVCEELMAHNLIERHRGNKASHAGHGLVQFTSSFRKALMEKINMNCLIAAAVAAHKEES